MSYITSIAYSSIELPDTLITFLNNIEGTENYALTYCDKTSKKDVSVISLSENLLRSQTPFLMFNLYYTTSTSKDSNEQFIRNFVTNNFGGSNNTLYINEISANFDDVKLIARNDLVNNVPMIKVRDQNPQDFIINNMQSQIGTDTLILPVLSEDVNGEISKL